MLDTLRCTARLDVIETLSNAEFDRALLDVCEDDKDKNCKGIDKNTTVGVYGAYRYAASTFLTSVSLVPAYVIGPRSTGGRPTKPGSAMAHVSLPA
jgi:hypothetical protein